MKIAAVLILLFLSVTGFASFVTGVPFYTATLLGAVVAVAAFSSGYQLIAPFRAWIDWKLVERDAIEHQRRVEEFEELFDSIRENAEPSSNYEEVDEAASHMDSFLPTEMDYEEAWAKYENGGWVIGVALLSYPNLNPVVLPDNYEGIPISYTVSEEAPVLSY